MGRLTPGQRGTAKERELAHRLEAEGWLVFRSAKSAGPYDLIAMNDDELLVVQVKRRKDKERHAEPRFIQELSASAPRSAVVQVVKQLWTWIERDAWYVTDAVSKKTERLSGGRR